jgi:SAM-dependent methyltransferase
MTGGHAKVESDLDRVNRSAWSATPVVEEFEKDGAPVALDAWSDPGERAAVVAVASEVRGRPILDVGVGGGRTTTALRLLSDDYLAIDYTPEMVAVCRRNHPEAHVELGDVRDLTWLPDGRFALVVFSFNGLDAVDHEDRQRALSEMSRVLMPGGLLVYSTHNKSGPCYGATPWRPAGSPVAHTWSTTYRIGRALAGVIEHPFHLPRSIANRRRLLRSAVDADGWGVGPVEAHDFGLLIHYVTLAQARAEVAAAGVSLEQAFDAERGARIRSEDDLSGVRYFHLVARKS